MTTTDSTLNFFQPIDQLRQTEVIDFLIHNQTEIAVKLQKAHYKTKVIKKKNEDLVVMHFTQIPFSKEPVVCSFEIGEDRYFFKSVLDSVYGEASVKKPEFIFVLQRRNDFRVNVPFSQSYECVIKRVNSRIEKFKVEVRDMSLGGCQVAINSNLLTIKNGYIVEISLKMHQFESEVIRCEARQIKEIVGSTTHLIGLKFQDVSAPFLTELQGLLVHLDRLQRGKKYD